MKLRTIRDAAEMLGVNENRVRRAARDGRIPSMQLGNRTLVDVDAARGVLSPEPEGVKIDVVSEETGLTVTAIRRAVRDGWLPYIKPGNRSDSDGCILRERTRKKCPLLYGRQSECRKYDFVYEPSSCLRKHGDMGTGSGNG